MSFQLKQITQARPTQDGAGVKIRRIHDFSGLMDPFLMLDELKASAREDYIGGFPPHPHRGFETLTYILHGGLTHEDSMGNKGEVKAGDAQWMSAASGVIHSEMPLLDSDGLHAFQLWINLPASEKMRAPRYRDLRAAQMGHLSWDSGHFTAIAGNWQTSQGSSQSQLAEVGKQASLADVELAAGSSLEITLPASHNLLVYCYQGKLGDHLTVGDMGNFRSTLQQGEDRLVLQADAQQTTRVLLLAGPALGEPIAHYGPFVMNSEAEIRQALTDYQTGQLVQQEVVITD